MPNKITNGIFNAGKPLLIPVLIGVMVLVAFLYLGLGTVNYNGDGLGYSNQVETASSKKIWFFSARLLYCPTGRLLHNALDIMGINVRSVYVFQVFNSVMGFLGAGVFFLSVFRLTRSLKLAALAALGLAFTFNFWFWNINVTSYPGNVFFLICCLFMLITIMDVRQRKKYFLYSAIIGLFHALACFYWLTAALLAPSIAIGIIIITSGFNFKNRLSAGIIYGFSFTVFLFVPLIIAAAYSSDVSNLSEFRTWLTYASQKLPPRISIGNFLRGIIGFSSSVFHMNFLGPFVKNALFAVPFVLTSTVQLICEIVAFIILWSIIAFNTFYYFRNRKKLSEKEIRLILTILLWALPPVIFGLTWLGSDTERWLAVIPIFWLLLLIPIWRTRRQAIDSETKLLHVFHGLVFLVFAYNLVFAVVPNHNPENNHYMMAAEAISENTDKDDFVVFWGYDHTFTGADLTYFFRIDCIHLAMFANRYRDKTEEKLIEKFDEVFARGGRVISIGRLFLDEDLPESRYQVSEHFISREELRRMLDRWERREMFTYKQDTFWELYIDNKK